MSANTNFKMRETERGLRKGGRFSWKEVGKAEIQGILWETERGWEKGERDTDKYLETKIGEKEREREKEREGGGGRGRERGRETERERKRERQKTRKPWEEERYQGSNTIVIIRELI